MCLVNAYLVYLQYDSPSKQISYGYVYSYRINAVFFSLVVMTEYIGRNFWRFAPKEHLKQGEKIHVYINGKYDRHATITSVSDDSVSIYGAVSLPVDYRGSFYAIGKDSVGAKLVYVKYRRRYRFVKFCELFRKGFCVEDDEEQLMPDSHSSENDETKDETEVENEM